jgi:hypothetical protein
MARGVNLFGSAGQVFELDRFLLFKNLPPIQTWALPDGVGTFLFPHKGKRVGEGEI